LWTQAKVEPKGFVHSEQGRGGRSTGFVWFCRCENSGALRQNKKRERERAPDKAELGVGELVSQASFV
jgi:hypothetical protein